MSLDKAESEELARQLAAWRSLYERASRINGELAEIDVARALKVDELEGIHKEMSVVQDILNAILADEEPDGEISELLSRELGEIMLMEMVV